MFLEKKMVAENSEEMIKRNCSPKPKDMINGFAKKIEKLKIIAPNNPPTSDERKAAESALDA